MFGSIAHYRPKPGHENAVRDLGDEWSITIGPTIPGHKIAFIGKPVDNPDQVVVIALMQDEKTYRDLAASPAQDAWYRRLREHLEVDPTWEDVEMEIQTA